VKPKTVFLTEKTHQKLKELCNQQGIKLNHIVDLIVREWLDKKEAKP
jgi:hypothetical protein